MRIGELAERAGTSARTLRYYEGHGLVHARRSTNGYRDYEESELRIVRQIRELLAVGFTLDDIRPFVTCLRAETSRATSAPTRCGCCGASSPRSTRASTGSERSVSGCTPSSRAR
jgi:DNA-binding transcriptional MerR regulator